MSALPLPPDAQLLTLRHSERVNPGLSRLTFHCPALAAAQDDQADDNVLLWRADAPEASARPYTVRARQDDTVVIDVHRHGPAGLGHWAVHAAPGATLLARPLPLSGACLRAADYPHHVLLGDDSALPLLGRWLERLPEGISAEVFVEIANPSARQPLAEDEDIAIQWLERNDFPATESQLLEDALTDYALPDHIEDMDAVFFVTAGEASRSARMAKFLIDAWAVEPDAIHHSGHWQG